MGTYVIEVPELDSEVIGDLRGRLEAVRSLDGQSAYWRLRNERNFFRYAKFRLPSTEPPTDARDRVIMQPLGGLRGHQ